MPISPEKYEKIIKEFIDKWGKIISKVILTDISDIWKWVKNYRFEIQKRDVQDKLIYIKRGINYINKLIADYTFEDSELRDLLVKCEYSIFKRDGVCSLKTKKELSNLIRDYNLFLSNVIGCQTSGADFMLGLLKSSPSVLKKMGPHYENIKNELEDQCLNLRMNRIFEKI